MKAPLIPVTFSSRVTIWIAAGYALWQGQGVILGGPQRFAGPSFAVLREAPHPTLFWGWLLIVAGAMIVAGSLLQRVTDPGLQLTGWLAKGLGCMLMAVWSFCFAKGALDAARAIETVPTTGGRTYVFVGLVVLVLVLIDERRPRRGL